MKYTCAMCEEEYETETPEDEAVAELRELFGDVPLDECDIVCDPCFQVLRPDRPENIDFAAQWKKRESKRCRRDRLGV